MSSPTSRSDARIGTAPPVSRSVYKAHEPLSSVDLASSSTLEKWNVAAASTQPRSGSEKQSHPHQTSALAHLHGVNTVLAMRPLRALGIYILAVFLGGALLAPWLYWLTQSFGQTFPHLANSPFHRFVNRSLLGLALIGLWPLLRSLRLNSWQDLGIVKPDQNWKRLGLGFTMGFVSLAVVAIAALATGARLLASPNHPGQKIAGAALTAIVVAVLEEILFRGALFGTLRKAFRWTVALVLSSMIYALVHFMESAHQSGPVLWYSGLELLPRMLRGFTHWQALVPGFFNLTLAGALLALAYQRTGNLYFSIGLHAGWIFWLKSYGVLTREGSGANPWIWGGAKLIDGWMALMILVSTFVLFMRMPLPSARTPAAES